MYAISLMTEKTRIIKLARQRQRFKDATTSSVINIIMPENGQAKIASEVLQ